MASGWIAVVLIAAAAVCATTGERKPERTDHGPWPRVIYADDRGILVPEDFGGIHHVTLVANYSGTRSGPDPNFSARINAVRLYGMNGLEWSATEKAPGQYDWSRWDEAFRIFRRAGVKTAIYVLYNPPAFYCRVPHNYGGWRMQLPNSRQAVEDWLSAITSRYPEVSVIEVANEVFAPDIEKGYWIGSDDQLAALCDWVLDWRATAGWRGKVWSPSIPGFLGNVPEFLRWLQNYPRTQEFDAIAAHFYHVTGDTFGQPAGAANAWTAFAELRDGLREAGIRQPIVDSEKGFDPDPSPESMAVKVYNYGLAALREGVQQVCFFDWGSYGEDETNLGQPFENAVTKQAFEALSALAGKRIVKIVEPAPGARWEVTFAAPAADNPRRRGPR